MSFGLRTEDGVTSDTRLRPYPRCVDYLGVQMDGC